MLGCCFLFELTLLTLVKLFNFGLSGPLFHFPFKRRVIMVLNMIICPAFQVLGDLRPAVAVDLMVLEDFVVFFGSPLHLLDVWVQVIVPSTSNYISSDDW